MPPNRDSILPRIGRLLLVLTLGCGCVSKETGPVSFYVDVSPILNEYCVRCHGFEKQEGQLDLTTLSAALSGGDSGPAVEAGEPESSLLWELVSDRSMPPEAPRPNRAERELIRRWIAGGAQD